MSKIIVEDLTDPKAIRDPYVEKMADYMYYYAAQTGAALGMSMEEVAAAITWVSTGVWIADRSRGNSRSSHARFSVTRTTRTTSSIRTRAARGDAPPATDGRGKCES